MDNNYNFNEVIKLPKRKLIVSSNDIILDKKNQFNLFRVNCISCDIYMLIK